MVEIGLRKGLSIEANALRRKLNYEYDSGFPGRLPDRGSASTWQLPILLKYRFQGPKVKPFVAIGPSFRPYTTQHHANARPSKIGITGGVGVEIGAGKFRISPTLRYTHWAAENQAPFNPTVANQLEVLVGFHYATASGLRTPSGRKIWLGIIAGVPLTNDLPPIAPDAILYSGTHKRMFNFRSAAGLLVEAPIIGNLSLEVNALYRRLHFKDVPNVVVTWQIPILAKYKFANSSNLTPYVEAGPSLRLTGNLNSTDPSHLGITAGIGVETHAKWLRVAPTLRYTRWKTDYPSRYAFQVFTKSDQVELLVGFSF
jgi:outer membrane protein W